MLSIVSFLKKIFFSVCLCLFSVQAIAYNIVFVHLGDRLPQYLVEATHQARLFNPSANIIVVAEQQAINHSDRDQFSSDGIHFVIVEELIRSDMHRLFLQKTSRDNSFREGFVLKCTERFYIIEELMKQYELNDLFHMEYDNMLYVDLQDLLSVFHTYPNIAATFDNDDRCIAGFIYFAHAQAAEKLAKYITNNCSAGWNDMQVIARYKNDYGEEEIGNLPIIMPDYSREHELITSTGSTVVSPDCYFAHFEDFNSIFDAAALGQFLGGIDPRNGHSAPGFINESCIFNPSRLAFEWIPDKEGRKVPFALFEETKCRINNLHIHSKKLKEFVS